MIFNIEVGILIIGVIIFFLQHKIKKGMNGLARSLVYWTVLLFISIGFNSLQFTQYPSSYTAQTYFTLSLFQFIILGTVVFLTVQIISPSKNIERIKRFFNKKSRDKDLDRGDEKSKNLRESQFEIFLETICFIGFFSTVILEGYVRFLDTLLIYEWNLVNTVCIVSLITIPITLRQIIFYLNAIKKMRYENNLSEREQRLRSKISRENTIL